MESLLGWATTGQCCSLVGVSNMGKSALFRHMHEIGAEYRMTLNKGTPEEQVLLDIPVWNFAWQLNYQPVDPIPVTRDDKITVECSWDRSLRFDPEPRYIFFADGTEDEMCFSTITIIPEEGPQPPAAEAD